MFVHCLENRPGNNLPANGAVLRRCGNVQCPSGACGHDDEQVLQRQAISPIARNAVRAPDRPAGAAARDSEGAHVNFSRLRVRTDAPGRPPAPEGDALASPRLTVHRSAPPIVHDVLRSTGQPLDAAVQERMGARFNYDFSRVRVHTGTSAAESARAVAALAYTVGSNIVFSGGQYRPDTAEGWRLLAHELTHVVQQRSQAGPTPCDLRVGSAADASEDQAERLASGAEEHVSADEHLAVRRQAETVDVELAPVSPEEAERLRRQGINLPTVSSKTWQGLTGRVGKPLTPEERARITQIVGSASPSGAPPAFSQGPRFVLHDTAGAVSAGWIAEQARKAHGPGGEGAAAYVPRAGAETIARPNFFDPRRPAATQFERGQDLMDKPTREQQYRRVWAAASTAERSAALTTALAGLSLAPADLTAETAAATRELNATAGEVHTTASWAVRELCAAVAAKGVASVAASLSSQAALQDACTRLAPVLQVRSERTASTANVEIVQEQGGTPRAPTPLPAYTSTQYQAISRLYLSAALQAGQWPEITTHFLIDRGIGDHNDPRCFDLDQLYRVIRAAMGHPPQVTYGITPSYGTGAANNVWWNPSACGGPPPSH
jgi:Domain of unknown function (DUF4157)